MDKNPSSNPHFLNTVSTAYLAPLHAYSAQGKRNGFEGRHSTISARHSTNSRTGPRFWRFFLLSASRLHKSYFHGGPSSKSLSLFCLPPRSLHPSTMLETLCYKNVNHHERRVTILSGTQVLQALGSSGP
eukprot:747923-Hanusia_phi.AAC.2